MNLRETAVSRIFQRIFTNKYNWKISDFQDDEILEALSEAYDEGYENFKYSDEYEDALYDRYQDGLYDGQEMMSF